MLNQARTTKNIMDHPLDERNCVVNSAVKHILVKKFKFCSSSLRHPSDTAVAIALISDVDIQ